MEESKLSAHHLVRQVLMNELGLTRQSVRDEVSLNVRELVAESVSSFMQSDRGFRAFLDEVVDREIRGNRQRHPEDPWYGRSLAECVQIAVNFAVANEVKKVVVDRLKVQVVAELEPLG